MSINTQGVGITKIIYSYSVQICLGGTAAWVQNEPIKDSTAGMTTADVLLITNPKMVKTECLKAEAVDS
ncbi:MAG: hypothetical protein RR728_02815 [Oscillospiraceae bacterium]